jgi:4-hydroxybenzoate polyprenyltransferase
MMIVAIIGSVVTVLVFFSGWLAIQLSRTQTALLQANEVLSTAVVSLAQEMIEMEKDMKSIEEDLAEHIRTLAVKLEADVNSIKNL